MSVDLIVCPVCDSQWYEEDELIEHMYDVHSARELSRQLADFATWTPGSTEL